MGYGKHWGYEHSHSKFELNGWFIEIGTFEFTAPEAFYGKVSWRYRMSRNKIVPGIWTDKNPRARKFETRCFTSMDEARAAARAAAAKSGSG